MTTSAPMARASDTGTGFTSAPSTRTPSSVSTGVNNPGMASDARTAASVDPVRSQTSAPVSSDVATAANGIARSSMGRSWKAAADERHEPLALEQTAGQAHVHERQHVATAHAAGAGTESIEFAGRVRGAHERADRGSADDVGPNACAFERAYYADVRPAACRAAAEHKRESRGAPGARQKRTHERTDSRPETPSQERSLYAQKLQIACRRTPARGTLSAAF